ncbi:651_t:CDS:2 [Entrophospora sp. SA101]|nr:651_t:CDS:2 [Entrophospora sp. SA101]
MSVQIHIILIFAGWSKKGGLIADRLDGVELERKKHPSIFKKTWDEINIHLSAKKFINEYNKQEKKEFMKHRSFDDDEYEPIATIERMMLDDWRSPYEVILNIIFSEQNIKIKTLYNDLYNHLLYFNIDFTSLLDKNHN